MKIVHFHNGSGGGVFSVIRNLLKYKQHPDIEYHVIYTINQNTNASFALPRLSGAASEKIFYYRPEWNFYHTCRKLDELLPGPDAVLIAHDWLELGMISNLGLQNPVVHMLHGDYEYYYRLARHHESGIDKFIAVSASIISSLKLQLPKRNRDMLYLRFPVHEINGEREPFTKVQLVFAGRCEESKGYRLLPVIDSILRQKNIKVHWHIAGPGSDCRESQNLWKNAEVTFHGNIPQNELAFLFLQATAIVLPSFAEGMPVAVVEAMKAGVIPVANDLGGGLQELVINDVTGFLVPQNNPAVFADFIFEIATDSFKREKMSAAARDYANQKFDPVQNSTLIEEQCVKAYGNRKIKRAFKSTGSRLDQTWIPNSLTRFIRKIHK